MFRGTFQKGFLTIFYAGGSSPLKIWDRMVVNGHIKRCNDEDVRTLALEMRGTNVATCYIFTPIDPKEVLGISLPFLVMIIKNLKKYFSFEIQILDDRNMRRRFRVSNYQTTTKVRPFGTTMPIGLNPGWNQIQFNLADFTKRAYGEPFRALLGSTYIETQRIQIHANCRIRRIYFCDRLYSDDELPNEYKLFYPCVEEKKKKEEEVKDERAEVPPPSEAGEEAEQEEVVEKVGEELPEEAEGPQEPEGGAVEAPPPEEPEAQGEEGLIIQPSAPMEEVQDEAAEDTEIGEEAVEEVAAAAEPAEEAEPAAPAEAEAAEAASTEEAPAEEAAATGD